MYDDQQLTVTGWVTVVRCNTLKTCISWVASLGRIYRPPLEGQVEEIIEMHTIKKVVGTVLAVLFALELAVPAFAQNSAWNYSVKKDISGKVTEIAMSDQSEGIGTDDSLIIRCKSTCEVYIHIGRSIAED